MIRTTTTSCVLLGLLACGCVVTPAHAAKQNPDVVRLSAQLEKLSSDPVLGQYAIAQQTLARNAIDALQNAGRGERQHDLFMAEQRVELAEAAAKVDADRAKLDQLQRRHDQIMLESSQADAAAARAQLARQRLQYQAAVEQAKMLQAQGAQAAQQAQQAQAEAAQAKKLAAAQERAARLARKEASLAEAATKALQGGAGSSAQTADSARIAPVSFVGKTSDLTAAGKREVADFAHAHAHQKIVIQPRAASDWRVLAGRRAVSVQAALEAAGASNVTIVGSVGKASRSAEVELHAE